MWENLEHWSSGQMALYTVLIEWIQSRRQYYENIAYVIDGVPQVTIIIIFTNSTSTKLLVSYNTQYRMSITAILCGHSNATTAVTIRKFCF